MLAESDYKELPKSIGSNRIVKASKNVEKLAGKIRQISQVSRKLKHDASIRVIRFAINRINPAVLVSMPYTGSDSLALFNDLCINPRGNDLIKLIQYLEGDIIKLREIAEGY